MSNLIWIKLAVNMFEDEKIRLIDAMPERDIIIYMWIRLLLQAAKTNSGGFIFLGEDIPYTDEMFSIIFCRPLNSIRFALKVLEGLKMIEFDESNFIKITNWEKHQNVSAMERAKELNKNRVAKHREKMKELEKANEDINECNGGVMLQKEDKEEDKEEDREEDEDIEFREREELENEAREKAIRILTHYERLLGTLNIFNRSSLHSAVMKHGEVYVTMAIDEAIKANKVDMTLVNEILRNWEKEGYPKLEESINGRGITKYQQSIRGFNDFKPNEAEITWEEKRRETEAKLI